MEEAQNPIKTLSQCKREISLEVPADRVENEYEQVLNRFRARAKIKGFRAGMAPADLVKSMYRNEIKNEIIDALAPDAIHQALRQARVNPAAPPVISNLEFEEGGPLRLTAQFEVWPEFELPDYRKIRVKAKKSETTDEDVDKSLQDLRERSARFVPVEDRGVAKDDFVMIEIKGRDMKTKKFMPTEKLYVMAGHEDNEENLNRAIEGIKTDQEKDFSVDYPADHANKRLAGKNIHYTVRILSIKEKALPELDDGFAREIGKFESLDELKQQIREELSSSGKQTAERELTEEVVQAVADQIEMEIPDSVIEQETLSQLRRMLSVRQGRRITSQEAEDLKKEAQSQAEKRIKNHLILTRIADNEKIEVSEEEIDAELKSIADANHVPLPQVKESARREGRLDELKGNLRLRKTVDFLRDKAIIKA